MFAAVTETPDHRIELEGELGRVDCRPLRELLLLTKRESGGEGDERLLALHILTSTYIQCDSVCLSHDMHVTHSHNVYRQWVSAG